MRRLTVGALVVAAVAGAATPTDSAVHSAAIGVFPSSTTIRGSAPLPATPARSVSLNTAIGEQEDAMVVVTGARQVRVIAPPSIAGLPLKVFFAHYVSFGGTLVPDALLPWDGSPRSTEQPNQPLWLQVTVPQGTAPGTYSAAVVVIADAASVSVPVTVKVFPVTLPPPNQVSGNLLTAFHVSAETYGNTVGKLYGYTKSEQFQAVSSTLYSFLASYRLSPNSWGYGNPKEKSGYASSEKWWLDSGANMVAEAKNRIFAAMSVPISNNRTAPSNYIAGLSPMKPDEWCSYLHSVHSFWQEHGWLDSFPYLYAMDEPGLARMHVVARQAATLHRCFPGGKALVTGNPSRNNMFRWNGGTDDLDVWVVLANRYYGSYTVPKQSRARHSRAREKLRVIDEARARGKMVWTYNYPGTSTPGFTAIEPLADSRLLFLWSAVENIRGVLYGEGTTNYQGDPLQSVGKNGAFVLLYPGKDSPIPSARLEQIRDGIEEWDILNIVRRKHGAAAVRKILGGTGLFSADAGGVKLGCTIGCEIKASTPFSWPAYSHDASTPGKIEQAKLQALQSAS